MANDRRVLDELAALYRRATLTPAGPGLPVPVYALFELATVVRGPGLMLVYGPGEPGLGDLLMSDCTAGPGADDFGNEYGSGPRVYRDAFMRASPHGVRVPGMEIT